MDTELTSSFRGYVNFRMKVQMSVISYGARGPSNRPPFIEMRAASNISVDYIGLPQISKLFLTVPL